MSNITLALGYLVVVLHEFWRQGVDRPVAVGTVLEVTRAERNNLVAGQVARDATDEEVAAHRGVPLGEEGPLDANETIAALAAAQAQLIALEAAASALQGQVEELTQKNAELNKELDELDTELEQLKGENAAQAKALEAAAKAPKASK